jgi:hypothetical protein
MSAESALPTRSLLKRHLVFFLSSFGMVSAFWLHPGSDQAGQLPLRLRLLGLSMVLPGPLGAIYWEVQHGQTANAVPWAIVFLGIIIAVIAGVHWQRYHLLRILGYLATLMWVLTGFLWSIAGL